MKQPLAYVHPDAKIANNVVIEPFVTIDKNVIIGEGTQIGSNVTILEGARIGKNCKIFPGAVISAIPQDLKFQGEDTTVEIGDNTTLRECVTVNRGTAAKGKTIVGSNCLIMAYSHIAHDCVVGDNVIISNATQVAGEVIIDNYDWRREPHSSVQPHRRTCDGTRRFSHQQRYTALHQSRPQSHILRRNKLHRAPSAQFQQRNHLQYPRNLSLLISIRHE